MGRGRGVSDSREAGYSAERTKQGVFCGARLHNIETLVMNIPLDLGTENIVSDAGGNKVILDHGGRT